MISHSQNATIFKQICVVFNDHVKSIAGFCHGERQIIFAGTSLEIKLRHLHVVKGLMCRLRLIVHHHYDIKDRGPAHISFQS